MLPIHTTYPVPIVYLVQVRTAVAPYTLLIKLLTTDEHHPHSATASGRPSRGPMAIRSTAATTSARKTLPTRSRPLGSRQGCSQSSLTRSLKATTPACPSRASRTSGKVSWDRTRRDSPFYRTFHITPYHCWPVFVGLIASHRPAS